MEMLFRRIEYWIEGDYTYQRKLKEQPWNKEKITKKFLKHLIFWLISFFIANTFLAYIIGRDELWEIQTDGISNHVSGFTAIIIFTTIFYLVFAKLREQVCTTICPYGRLQGVLLDSNSMVISYDYIRGEKRAKFRKNEIRSEVNKGDCIDCRQCVYVCPTGIDIRNGTQLECINCTACIDACDHMMESVGLPKGLIAFKSENNIVQKTKFVWTSRVKAYSAVLLLLIGVVITAMATRKNFESNIFRLRGTTYEIENSNVVNIYEIYLTNRTNTKYDIEFKLPENQKGEIKKVVNKLVLPPEGLIKESFIIKRDKPRSAVLIKYYTD
jgi:cytochrome c oxidase accessory protein FixG